MQVSLLSPAITTPIIIVTETHFFSVHSTALPIVSFLPFVWVFHTETGDLNGKIQL